MVCKLKAANFSFLDISWGVPRLVSHCRGFGQVYAIDIHQGLMAASDQHGNVALINHAGIMWKRKSPGEFGWMVGTYFLILPMHPLIVSHGNERALPTEFEWTVNG